MVPLRDETTTHLLAEFKRLMCKLDEPLIPVEDGELVGQDDWDADGEIPQVRCWWGVFSRATKS
jgi:hypothetical protein